MFDTEAHPWPADLSPEEVIDSLVEDPPGTPEPVRWSQYFPDGMLADMLAYPADTAPEHREVEALERVGGWERVIAWAQARQLRDIASFMHRAQARNRALGADDAQAHESAVAEVGLMLTASARSAACRVGDAWSLCTRLPATLAALESGQISLTKARIVDAETMNLSAEHTARVEQQVLTKAAKQTPGQLRAATRRAVVLADPAAAQRRADQARRERGVRIWPEPDGMATLSAHLPAADAVGVFAVLDEHARQAGSAGDERGMDARRADALVDLVLNPTGYRSQGTSAAHCQANQHPGADHHRRSAPSRESASPTAHGTAETSDTASRGSTFPTFEDTEVSNGSGDTFHHPSDRTVETSDGTDEDAPSAQQRQTAVPTAEVTSSVGCRCQCGRCRRGGGVDVRVTIPYPALLGADDLPGELAGYGPIPAAVARDLAAGGTWRRILTDPQSGRPVDYGTTRYRPPTHLAGLVITRDQTCQFPGCRIPAHRCDIDHGIPYNPHSDTGPTSEVNLGPKCRRHHQIKQTPGWSVIHHPDGCTSWTTPSGHIYHSQPPPLTNPEPLTPHPTASQCEPPPF